LVKGREAPVQAYKIAAEAPAPPASAALPVTPPEAGVPPAAGVRTDVEMDVGAGA
jgi:hypothetical protein